MPVTPEYSYQLAPYIQFQTFTKKPPLDLIELTQSHSNHVIANPHLKDDRQGDGMVVFFKDIISPLFLAIKTADCLPVGLYGEDGVGIIHAGWKGLANQILCSPPVHQIKPLKAVIGPCISKLSYEVTSDFQRQFSYSHHFHQQSEKLFFDLIAEAKQQLHRSFHTIEVFDSGIDTMQDYRFNSYRRDKTELRNWNILSTD